MKTGNAIRKLKSRRRTLLAGYCFSRGITKLRYPPIEVFIEPTNHCNLKCIICPHGVGIKREKGFMPLEIFKKILAEVVKAGVLKVTLNFAGEPLLNKDIFEMMRLAKENNLYARMHTNALLMPEDYARKIILSGLDELSFSFDDHRKEVYERIRANASYEKVLANIRAYLKIKKELKAHYPYTIIQQIKLKDVEYSQSQDADYRRLFWGLPVDKFHAVSAHNWAGVCQEGFIEKYDASCPLKIPCDVIWMRLAIGWDAEVFACCNDMNGRLPVGDLKEAGLLDIWNGPAILELRRIMLGSRYGEVEACKNCDVLLRAKRGNMGITKSALARLFLAFAQK